MDKTVSIISTGLQLINCAEYIKAQGEHNNVLVVYASSKRRIAQIKALIANKTYDGIFEKIVYLREFSNRYLNVFNVILNIIRLYLISIGKTKCCIAGNYLMASHRFLIARFNKRDVKVVLVDDGLTTTEVAKWRPIELKEGIVHMFNGSFTTRLFYLPVRRYCVPKKVQYFTVYDVNVSSIGDEYIRCDYEYLKSHIQNFEINSEVFSGECFFISQPLYKSIITKHSYCSYLNEFAKLTDKKDIIYIPHPSEDNFEQEIIPSLAKKYRVIKTSLPFEIIASIIKPGASVFTFYSSVIVNLMEMRKDLELVAIYLSEIDGFQDSLSSIWMGIKDSYSYFEEKEIRILKFPPIN